MRWRDQRQSTNVEDRRGMGGKGIAIGGGSIGMLVLVLAVYLCGGGDLAQFLNQMPATQEQTQTEPQQPQGQQANDELGQFARAVIGSTEDVWKQVLPQQARAAYRFPVLVLFTNQVQSACGVAGASTGPFYCPGDEKLYLDFGFFRELKNEFRAPGDFAQAYVIAHEVGHHVQNILGTMDKVQRAGNSNALSVRLELQADCYAGVWSFYANQKGLVEAGDPEEALRAASAVGDDSIQKRGQGYVVPESFTHGTSNDRMTWFARGFKSGDMRQCDTFR
jgi:uncharacterized protein